MSGSVLGSTFTEFSLMGQVITNSATTKQKLDRLTAQASNGLIATTYSGLGAGAPIALSLAPQIKSLHTWNNNISAAAGKMHVMQTAMGQIESITSKLLADLNSLNGVSPSGVTSIAANARNDLIQMAQLLNSRDGSDYVFGGEASESPPIPDASGINDSDFVRQIAAAVGGLGGTGAAATAAQTLTIASSNAPGTSPFSTYLSQDSSALRVLEVASGPGQYTSVGMLASANTAAVSTGTSTTGSYIRDVMRALATVGSLKEGQVSDPGFNEFVQDTRTSLQGAITAMAADIGVLGDTQARLQAQQTRLSDTETALTEQISNVQDVDMAATLSNLTSVQTQLQASYQLIAMVNGLSLAKFLPPS